MTKAPVILLTLLLLACDRPSAVAPPRDDDHGRPVEAIARDLGVTPDQFREAFKLVNPAPRGQEPTRAQRERNRRVLSEALGVDPEKLDAVMDKYRPEGPNRWPPPQPNEGNPTHTP
jgi:hypothetical protein